MLSVTRQSVKNTGRQSTHSAGAVAQNQVWRRSLVTLCLSSLVCIGFSGAILPVLADVDDMTKLEIRFFQHNYPKDSQEARLDRLEKMVFGEVKTGSEGERLSRLVSSVPAGDPTAAADAPRGGGRSGGGTTSSAPSSESDSLVDDPRPMNSPSSGSPSRNSAPATTTADSDADEPVKTDEKYPAVTAIEQKTLGKDYAGEPVNKRLARLETKVFGKPSSNSVDLSDRVDALKQKTGIDVARVAPKGSDWQEDDDDIAVSPRSTPRPRGENYTPSSNPREDAMSFSGRNLQEDMQRAFGTRGGSSSYGGGGSSGSGSYGMGGGGGSTYPVSPQSFGSRAPISENPGGMGLAQQVSALETEIFQKTYHDPLPTRLNRLEGTVFPSDKTLGDKSLPDRVANLVAKVPISSPGQSSPSRKTARASRDDDDDMNDLISGGSSGGGMSMGGSSLAQQQPKKSGGLGKLMSSLGSMVTGGGGGYGYTGGYPMAGGGAMAVDPTSGMLYDPVSGNLINPNTGQIVGRRGSAYNTYGGGYGSGYGSSYGYNGGGFNNGFSPYGSINRGFSPGFGIGNGIRMGGVGGMWP